MTRQSTRGAERVRERAAACADERAGLTCRTALLCAAMLLTVGGFAGPASAQPSSTEAAVLAEQDQVTEWPAPIREDAHSLCMPTGPPPEEGYEPYLGGIRQRGTKVISGVPAYLWYRGCGPTAAGMVIGYWDGRGFDDLIPGDASSQTAAVDDAIANNLHYADYSLPIDNPGTGLLPDNSYYGGAHTSNCIGDFMETSWYIRSCYYGWSYFSDVDDALRDYVTYINTTQGTEYEADSWNESWGTFTWYKFTVEIDSDRPLVFLVDTDGDDSTDHFVTVIGYRDTSGYQEYACLDTWSTSVRWERFRGLAPGNDWGIYGATYFFILGAEDCNGNDVPDLCDVDCGPSGGLCDRPDCGGSNDCNSNLVPDECDIADATSDDCNVNDVPDECDIFLASTITSGSPLYLPGGITQDTTTGDFMVIDISARTLFRVTAGGTVTSIAPLGFGKPYGVAQDASTGDFIVTDNTGSKLVRVTPGGVVTEITSGAPLSAPRGVTQDTATGDFIVTDTGADALFRVTAGGVVTTIASGAPFGNPRDVTQDASTGDFIVVDALTDAVYRVTTGGVVTTIASGLPLDSPRGVSQEALTGDFIVASTVSARVLRVAPGGAVTDLVPTGTFVSPVGVCRDSTTGDMVLVDQLGPDVVRVEVRDCNGNGEPDDCDIDPGLSEDCQPNGVPDECDIASGASTDDNANDIPDECEITCTCGDLDGSGGTVNLSDFNLFQVCYGLRAPTPQCPADLFDCADFNADDWINNSDFNTFQVLFGNVNTNSPPDCI